jgi:hypothetical protein
LITREHPKWNYYNEKMVINCRYGSQLWRCGR